MNNYVINSYGKKPAFSSFLPGISGFHGIPIWCFYVNRGQGVVSFGVDNKQNSIMEFYPAHQAYQNVKTTGFRTFIKRDSEVYEPFSNEDIPSKMEIGMNTLELEEENRHIGLKVRAGYFTLPDERIGGLVRSLTVTNISKEIFEVDLIDGMPAVIPCGVDLARIQQIGQTAKAWMQVEDEAERTPYYRARASLADSAEVATVEAGNFALGFRSDGALLPVLVDAAQVFGYDTSLRRPVGLELHALADILAAEQATANTMPCAFFAQTVLLLPGESRTIYELYGQVPNKTALREYLSETRDAAYFSKKRVRAISLTEELGSKVYTRTASPSFDAYCQYNYMDNILRGGYPVRLGKEKVFYAFSRKHGDLERDYNQFSMLPEYYSQGNGHFRDVNQNRRCDTFLTPFVGMENIRKFYSLIQLDGYNPLSIEKLTYRLTAEDAERLCGREFPELVGRLCGQPFTPGQLYCGLEKRVSPDKRDMLFGQIMDASENIVNEDFGEGYWTDHWTYNLDLVEEYLEVFPERERELFYDEQLSCFLSQININDRRKRYVETKRGLRQYLALNESSRRNDPEKLVRTRMQQGEVLKMSLLEKLVLLCATKFAALDAYGMGIEMEGGKPGWYDALNGLPGMFGSSMNETYELYRMLVFTIERLNKHNIPLPVLNELSELLAALAKANQEEYAALHRCDTVSDAAEIRAQGQVLEFWNKINDAKEAYRSTTFSGVSGGKTLMDAGALSELLRKFADTVYSGIHKATALGHGSVPTYFAYEVPEYSRMEDGFLPLRFIPVETPHFLEGAVRYLKLPGSLKEKRRVYEAVKSSDLYDAKLKMYKVNASLSQASYELGRAVAFTPGWLENESVWLHMEYKYLLELLKCGLYEEFFEDFKNAAVPFMDPDTYGRSVYENSSFIVSSAYPNQALHGKGYVARLSGSTAEFISMWKRMMFGGHILSMREGKLCFTPQPAIPQYLISPNGTITVKLFGETDVLYHFGDMKDFIPGRYEIRSMTFSYANGQTGEVRGGQADGSIPYDLRNGLIRSVRIEID